MFKRVLTVILTLVMLMSVVPVKAESSINVFNAEDFLAMTTGTYELKNDIDFSGVSLDGGALDKFAGTLDGNGYSIKNIDFEASGDAALINKLTGTVRNLKIQGEITAAPTGDTSVYIAPVAMVNTGKIINCVNELTVVVTGGANVAVGGISAQNYWDGTQGEVRNCVNKGSITVKSDAAGGRMYAGGITALNGKVYDSENISAITLDAKNSVISYVGGIAAYNTSVTNSVNNGAVTVCGDIQAYAGGIAAFYDAVTFMMINDCENNGAVSATVTSEGGTEDDESIYAAAGGIIGYNACEFDFTEDGEVYEDAHYAIVMNALNKGAVSASAENAGKSYAGGIIGIVNGLVFNCVNVYTGAITADACGQVYGAINPVGQLRGLLRDCYTAVSTATHTPLNPTPNTVADMAVLDAGALKKVECYEGFDFVNVWDMGLVHPELLTGATHSHYYSDVHYPANCEDDEKTVYTCRMCGDTYTDINYGTFKGHSFTNYVYNNDATVEKDGTETAKCDNCDKKDTRIKADTKLPKPMPEPPEFSDVAEGKWYYDAIRYVAAYGVMDGTSDTTFEPNTKLNRATFVTILSKVAGVYTTLDKNAKTAFSDVPVGKWYTGAIAWAAKEGVVNGLSETKFGPTDPVTREQMCTMLVRYAKAEGITIDNTVNKRVLFTDDADISGWAKDHVYTCQMSGLVNGIGDGKFGPRETANRAQAAKIFMGFHKDYLA